MHWACPSVRLSVCLSLVKLPSCIFTLKCKNVIFSKTKQLRAMVFIDYHIAGCCQLANPMSWSQTYILHCMVLSPANLTACHPRATYPIQGSCQSVKVLDFFQIFKALKVLENRHAPCKSLIFSRFSRLWNSLKTDMLLESLWIFVWKALKVLEFDFWKQVIFSVSRDLESKMQMECCRNIWSSLTKYKVAQDRSRYVIRIFQSGKWQQWHRRCSWFLVAWNAGQHQVFPPTMVGCPAGAVAVAWTGYSKTRTFCWQADEDWQPCMWHLWSTTTGLWSCSRSWCHTKHWCEKQTVTFSSCLNTRHRYRTFLEDQKKEQAKAASAGKRKAVNDEVDQLKKRNSTMSVW